MLINAYKNIGNPREAYIYTHSLVEKYEDLDKLIKESHEPCSFYEGQLIFLNKVDKMFADLKYVGTMPYNSLPSSIHRDLTKRALAQKFSESGLKKKGKSIFIMSKIPLCHQSKFLEYM